MLLYFFSNIKRSAYLIKTFVSQVREDTIVLTFDDFRFDSHKVDRLGRVICAYLVSVHLQKTETDD